MRKYLAVLVMALVAAPLFADIELSTSINDVYHRGSNELAGSITMNVNEDDFNEASTDEPIFIRVTLDHQARLAETLVDQCLPSNTSLPDYIEDPLWLAMQVNSLTPGVSIGAHPETASIVRWVAGESSIWIRIQTDSATWIDLGTGTLPPQEGLTVSWTIGVSARKSHDDNDEFFGSRSNLPFNTRDSGTIGLDEDASSTLICTNLSSSTLTTDGVESLLNYDPIAFDNRAEIDRDCGEFSAQAGTDTGINFTNDFAIARGKDRSCDVTIPDKQGPTYVSLCVSQAGTNQTQEGFLQMCNTLEWSVDCERGGLFLDTDLLSGAYVTLSTNGRGTYGFSEDQYTYFYPVQGDTVTWGDYEVDTDTEFSSHGEDLYRTVDLIWDSETKILDDYRFGINACVEYHYEDGPVDVDLDWSITLVNHDGARDDDPFDGDDQFRRCDPSEFVIGSGVWEFGVFTDCVGAPVSIFFPYLPKLQDGDFWAGLSLVNQGGVDFEEGGVEAIFYHEDGAEFAAALPALDVRNQYTWLIVDEEQGPGLYGLGAYDGVFIAPEPASEANEPGDFGNTRSSLFVVGTFVANWLEEVYLGDLDGYLLVGAGTDIDGSYLPRNYDNDIPGQNADLPLLRSKKSNGSAVLEQTIGDHVPSKYLFENGKRMR